MKTIKISSLSAVLFFCSRVFAADQPLETGHEYMIALNYPNNLHVIDVQSDKIFKTCQLPDAFGPGTAQVAPGGKIAYILNNHYGDIYGVDMDDCKTVFHAELAFNPGEKAKAMFSLAVSPDGKEIYSVVNPSLLFNDHFKVLAPRLQVYSADAGLRAKPARTFEVPRQISVMQTGRDGTLYMAGADIFKLDVKTGKYEVALASRNWNRPLYSAPDVLYVWPQQTYTNDFSLLYTALKFKDKKLDPATAELLYGYMSIDLETGKSTVADFAPVNELYFTGLRSPKHPDQMFGVLNRLTKYDIKTKKLLAASDLEHTYYCVAFNKAGTKLYLAGTYNDIAIFDPETLKKTGSIKLPGGDMALMTTQVFSR
jgi:quinohemoprotein amine dehydrogenase beta subunit